MMVADKTDKQVPEKKNRALEIANTFEWLITAFILAFVFRAFVMEAFRIPTGSMAETLNGANYRLRCGQCGYQYDFGFDEQFKMSRCPSCGYYQAIGRDMPVSDGDRILVLKCIYQFFQPKQWDVVVFKNPPDPNINYIKRMIARPGETVEIIDGDIYINGKISRKPARIQDELWMIVYDNDYQPVHPLEGNFNGHTWQQPFDVTNSQWKVCKDNPTRFCLDSQIGQEQLLKYDTTVGNDFRDSYAYNDFRWYKTLPYCSDLKVRFYVNSSQQQGRIGATLSKYDSNYKGWLDLNGQMIIAKAGQQKDEILAKRQLAGYDNKKLMKVEFANVDHRLILRVDDQEVSYDFGTDPNAMGPRNADIQPTAQIFGFGKFELSHIAIFRDIHYTSSGRRGMEGKPVKLEKDQYFVLGDNSPNSSDSRYWEIDGKGNDGKTYRQGIVPADYLVGKAMFVYWPGGFKPFPWFRLAIVPNVGKMRFIYGGSEAQ